MSDLKNIIVIGASAGGLAAIKELLAIVPENMPVAIFIVMHVAKVSSPQIIKTILEKHTSYNFCIPEDGETIREGTIYFAPPDVHMLIKPEQIRLINAPHENRWRPSIDVLFRSAAVAFNARAIGIILTGLLDDGTSGMQAVKRSGGICMVQEPVDAEFPDMPVSVLNNVDVDYRVPVAEMGYVLADIFSKPAASPAPVPEDIRIESEITERMTSNITDLEKIGTHSNYVCPDCGGGLWQIKNENGLRYRCYTGHVYTANLLLEKQNESLEESLWVSIRMMEERRNLQLNMASQQNGKDNNIQKDLITKAEELRIHIERLKELLISVHNNASTTDEGYL
ncbi:chemotaxis protein CheB [Mucilaginibacter robiniae]|uniref:protein-glutamate methylesterase n=1 Tax=Mucilaginibacter robiniae TaxID=2728022 RepID=A0A7L5E8J2_9SPHI|nr:chemotaxis protein CheB [Mucilaginibacter robiniae]QJD96686.1 chemotaxis protein CheB [Mucilaginibacter robiniae]